MAKVEELTPEAAVRLYLMFLEDPQRLVDPKAVKDLEAKVAGAKDPLDKLRSLAALERARAVDESTYRLDFVRYAKKWAETEGVPMTAFASMGVPRDVLAQAGFNGGATAGKRRATKAGGVPSLRAPRAKKVSTDTITDFILSQGESFTLADIMSNVGGSPTTVKKALEPLVAGGKVLNLGPKTDHRGQGRAPILYRVSAG